MSEYRWKGPPCPECGEPMLDEGESWFCARSHRAIYIADKGTVTSDRQAVNRSGVPSAEAVRLVEDYGDAVRTLAEDERLGYGEMPAQPLAISRQDVRDAKAALLAFIQATLESR